MKSPDCVQRLKYFAPTGPIGPRKIKFEKDVPLIVHAKRAADKLNIQMRVFRIS